MKSPHLRVFEKTCKEQLRNYDIHSTYVGLMNFIMASVEDAEKLKYIRVLHSTYQQERS